MRIGIDDTDSPRGGCTTWVLTELVRLAREHHLDLLGEPHLVRLNPNVPWKTRGNAALALRLGTGTGRGRTVGEIDGRPVVAFRSGRELAVEDGEEYLDDAWRAVSAAAPREPGTDPAMVAVTRSLPASLYRQAVTDRVTVAEAWRLLRAAGARTWVRGGRRGLVGASAAVAWPARRSTWELLAYREPARIGRRRVVDPESVRAAARRHPELFLCVDERTRRLLVAPHSPCPILYGLRATAPGASLAARQEVRSEAVDRWMLFRTNQGTGDHLRRRRAPELTGYRSGRVRGTVLGRADSLPGGHARFSVADRGGASLTCVAFEPTKTLPEVARSLRPGDEVEVWGSAAPRSTIRLEGISVLRLVRDGRWRPPTCPACGVRTGSLGAGRGWRCGRCRRRLPPESAEWLDAPRALELRPYHPTPSARRHLAPLAP